MPTDTETHRPLTTRARVQAVALAAACWTVLLPLAAYRGLL
jgi:hypothetical protein